MKKLSLIFLSFLAFGLVNSALAGWGTISVSSTDAKMVNPSIMPPISQGTAQYSFDATAVKTLVTKDNSLLQINCNTTAIMKVLGFGSSTQKLFSVGIENNGFEYTFDMKNCSLRANKINNVYNYSNSLTEQQALDFAAAFMKDSYLKDKVYYQLGKAFVAYKNSNGPIYPMMKDVTSTVQNGSDIEIDTTDTGGEVVPEYTSFSIVYPYIINGQEVRDQYGNRIGIQLEVSSDGVMSMNARLLLFKWAKRTSEKLSGDDAVRILNNGGNSPAYNQSTTIKLAAPQKVFVLFSLWRNNLNYNYLSSGIGLKSTVKLDQYAQQPYTMILSDYKIGNAAQ
jgi:hypothetical protein